MKKITVCALLVLVSLLCACSRPLDYDITNDSVMLIPERYGIYVNPDDPEDSYRSVTIDGRVYLPYGVQGTRMTGDQIGKCIAFELHDQNNRYYQVIGNEDFVANYYITGVMEQFSFLRAQDTIGKDIAIPSFIDSLQYDIWK